MALSTVPAGVATEALGYLREGGPENLRELARFLSDTVFLTGEGFAPPTHRPPRPPPPPRHRCHDREQFRPDSAHVCSRS
jgi:Cobalamin biosynthesis protein CobN and related Mg-chelatases